MAVLGEFTPYKASYDFSVCANLNVQIIGKRPNSKLHPVRHERDFTNETLSFFTIILCRDFKDENEGSINIPGDTGPQLRQVSPIFLKQQPAQIRYEQMTNNSIKLKHL